MLAPGSETASSGGAHIPALVVGAGPTGLSAALALRRHGQPATVVEAEPEERQRPGSRAIYIHRETLRLLEEIQRGLGREIAAAGLVWHTRRTFWRGREVFTRRYPPPAPNVLPPFASLSQVEIERALLAACRAAGVAFVWGAPVTGVETAPDGVTVTTASGQAWTADYLIAADGARSAVRRALGIPLEGSRSTNAFIVVDAAEDPEHPLEAARTFHYEHPAVGRRNVLLVPFAGGWRIDLQCHNDDDLAELGTVGGVRQWLPRVLPAGYADRITWVSTYRFLQVVAPAFADPKRRVLLTGEAAHLFAPFGARGMNSGIADAVAAASAIDEALKASDSSEARAAVEAFARDRHAAAEYNRAAAGQALAHMQARDPVMRLRRYTAALLAPDWQRMGAWLDSGPYGPRSGPPGRGSSKY